MYFEECLLLLISIAVMRYGSENKTVKNALGFGCVIIGLLIFVVQTLYIGGVIKTPIR